MCSWRSKWSFRSTRRWMTPSARTAPMLKRWREPEDVELDEEDAVAVDELEDVADRRG
jgi:hypothetical protein